MYGLNKQNMIKKEPDTRKVFWFFFSPDFLDQKSIVTLPERMMICLLIQRERSGIL